MKMEKAYTIPDTQPLRHATAEERAFVVEQMLEFDTLTHAKTLYGVRHICDILIKAVCAYKGRYAAESFSDYDEESGELTGCSEDKFEDVPCTESLSQSQIGKTTEETYDDAYVYIKKYRDMVKEDREEEHIMSKFTRAQSLACWLVLHTDLRNDPEIYDTMYQCVWCHLRYPLSRLYTEFYPVMRHNGNSKYEFLSDIFASPCELKDEYKTAQKTHSDTILGIIQDYDYHHEATIHTFLMRKHKSHIKEIVMSIAKYAVPYNRYEWEKRFYILRAINELSAEGVKNPSIDQIGTLIETRYNLTISYKLLETLRETRCSTEYTFSDLAGDDRESTETRDERLDRIFALRAVNTREYDISAEYIEAANRKYIADTIDNMPPISRLCLLFAADTDSTTEKNLDALRAYILVHVPNFARTDAELATINRSARRMYKNELERAGITQC